MLYSYHFSPAGLTSSSCVQADGSCSCSAQYVSAIAAGFKKKSSGLSCLDALVLGRSTTPSMLTWAMCIFCTSKTSYLLCRPIHDPNAAYDHQLTSSVASWLPRTNSTILTQIYHFSMAGRKSSSCVHAEGSCL